MTAARSPDRARDPIHPWTGALGVLGVLLVSIVLTASPAMAHDQLVETSPADAAVVDTAPVEVTLRFTEEVMNISSQVIVRGPTGEVLADTEAVVSGSLVSAPLPAGLANGSYTVAWRVVSGDGHPIEGTLGFTIAASADPAAPVAPLATPTSPGAPLASSTPVPTSGTATEAADAGSMTGPSTIGIVLGLLAAVVAGTAVALVLLRRRRTS
jgi:copper resistance protein C